MKSELTIEIENKLREFDTEFLSGLKLNHARDSIRVVECTVQNSNVRKGIIDFVRYDEYITSTDKINLCWLNWKADAKFCELKIAKGERRKKCEQVSCRFNATKDVEENHNLVTCMEIKISKHDFYSENGHNFVGNLNYYVLTKDVLKDVENDVPKDIGIILYDNKRLLEYRQSSFKELSVEEQLERIICILKASRKERNYAFNKCHKIKRYRKK